MKIGVLRVSVQGEKKNSKGYYNSQFLGLAKALDRLFDEVVVYEHILRGQIESTEEISGCKHAILHRIAVKNIGVNGIVRLSKLDVSMDVLVLFSDIQLSVPRIYRWAKRNHIIVLPYIGVLESHSISPFNRSLMKIVINRNIKTYKKCHCLAKTPYIRQKLVESGIRDVSLMPVGLDTFLLKKDYFKISREECAKEFGILPEHKVVLFVGRLMEEKQPLRMIDIFNDICSIEPEFRLFMIGDGELKKSVINKVEKLGLSEYVRMIDSFPNQDMWKLYRIADSFVNLNEQEIFGMAILEAMYYGCKVVALHAPGPDFIIEDEISGILCNANKDIVQGILNDADYSVRAKERVVDYFTWDVTSRKIPEVIKNLAGGY